jgi:hypothetical protein
MGRRPVPGQPQQAERDRIAGGVEQEQGQREAVDHLVRPRPSRPAQALEHPWPDQQDQANLEEAERHDAQGRRPHVEMRSPGTPTIDGG